MASDDAPESPGAVRRARTPTITVDTSATTQETSEQATEAQQTSLESNSRPASPHNVSSTNGGNPNAFLSVPGNHSRNTSLDVEKEEHSSSTEGAQTSDNTASDASEKKGQGADILSDEKALEPDPGTEADFSVEDNKFAFSPGQLSKLLNPKSLGAFHALGGLAGLEKGLRTNRKTGLSVEEDHISGYVSFEEALNRTSSVSSSKETDAQLKHHDTTGGAKSAGSGFTDRKRVFSDNRLPERKPKNILQLAWIAYNDKVLILLTVAAVISLALGLYQTFGQKHDPKKGASVEWIEGVAITVAIVIVVAVGALNDWQKERQFVKLNKRKDDRTIKVVRSGNTREISVYDVFVGDVVMLEPGDMVPVDGIFIEGHNVKCDESSATGESDLLKKTPADDVMNAIESNSSVKKMDPFILSGAKVAEGVGSFVVTATGVNSTFGKTMMSLREDNEVTPLQSKLNVLAEYIAKLGGAAALLLFIVLLIEFLAHLRNDSRTPSEKGQNFLNILIVAITVIVVAVPEGLPLAVTLALAFATTRMLKDNNLVRVLRSCETMGNATTVCSDKTGTLTQNKMTVVAGTLGTALRFGDQKVSAGADDDPTEKGKRPPSPGADGADDVSATEFVSVMHDDVKHLLMQSIAINSTAFEGEEDGKPAFIGSKTETALLDFARSHLGMGPVSTERSNATIVQLIPFDSGRKCMGVVVKTAAGTYRMYVKGASEILLAKCDTIIADVKRGTADAPLTDENRESLGNLISTYASRSLRTIACLYKDFEQWPPRGAKTQEDDRSLADFDDVFDAMVFLGVVGIQDPLRPGVTDAVKDCQRAGVFVRMVTGDNVLTAKAIATDCGILVPGGVVMEGPVFRKLGRRQMDAIIPKLCVLARSSPEDKRILVRRLKQLGETVAVTGDGTNDAPALKTADVGFSMGIAGTEVAKEASAIILMDDNFSSIVKALLWGRAVNDAVRKFLQFQITVNITAVFLTFVSAVASADQSSVLTAVQLLWVNLIMDTFAALALATDPPTRGLLGRKPDPKSAPLISLNMWKMIMGQAVYQLVITFILHFAGARILNYDTPEELEKMNTLVFNTFVWMQIFNMINNRRLDNKFNIFEGVHHNYFFIFIAGIMIGGQVMIVFIGGQAFSVKRLTSAQWGYSILLGVLSIPVGVFIRLIPDELIRSLIPNSFRRRKMPDETVVEEYQWHQGLLDIREELAFIRKIRGGRLGALKFKLQNPRETLHLQRRSQDLPSTPLGGAGADQAHHQDATSPAHAPPTPQPPPSPDARAGRRRTRSRSNSAFGAAAAAAGIVAGSIAGWSPIERPQQGDATGGDDAAATAAHPPGSGNPASGGPAVRARSRSDLEAQRGVELAPGTRAGDPVLVGEREMVERRGPPSQAKETTPDFGVGPFAEKGDGKGEGKRDGDGDGDGGDGGKAFEKETK